MHFLHFKFLLTFVRFSGPTKLKHLKFHVILTLTVIVLFAKERLTIEEPLQSAPVVERLNFDIEPSSLPTFEEKTNHDTWSTESIKNSLEASSVESLFRFADQLVKEATNEAKDTLKEELSLSFHSNSLQSLDFTSPKDIGTAEEPGKMIDMYLEKGKKYLY